MASWCCRGRSGKFDKSLWLHALRHVDGVWAVALRDPDVGVRAESVRSPERGAAADGDEGDLLVQRFSRSPHEVTQHALRQTAVAEGFCDDDVVEVEVRRAVRCGLWPAEFGEALRYGTAST